MPKTTTVKKPTKIEEPEEIKTPVIVTAQDVADDLADAEIAK